jgi:UDP:flavonoid glycosyltransferase YjiC (YdhE family)
MANKKIIILIPPYYGHLNPVCCLVNYLVTKYNHKIIFYGNEKFRSMIEKTGSDYREYPYFPTRVLSNDDFTLFDVLNTILDITYKNMDHLIEMCELEKPDLIICDNVSYHAKYLMNYLQKTARDGRLNYNLPKLLQVYQSFAFMQGIWPSQKEMRMMTGKFSLNIFKQSLQIFLKNRNIIKKYNLDLPMFFRRVSKKFDDEEIERMCFVLEELHPRTDLLKSKIKFIGCCIEDRMRNSEQIENEKLKQFLNLFEPINPNFNIVKSNQDKNNNNHLRLIYVSFGTVINYVFNVFEVIINALKTIDIDKTIRFKDLRIIISTGDETYLKYENKILPDNILILPKVPQIEVLKRASLFITHAGMNSMNESVHYGVPVICLPISTDQPFVAIRACDELNLGLRLDYRTVTSDQMRSAIIKLLNDDTYSNKMLDYAKLSKESNGVLNGAKLVEDYLNRPILMHNVTTTTTISNKSSFGLKLMASLFMIPMIGIYLYRIKLNN